MEIEGGCAGLLVTIIMRLKKRQLRKWSEAMSEIENEQIFIVDDDQGILDSFDAMLGDDYHLILLSNSREALALICERKPRLLFLDIKMPGMNGIELLRRIQDCGFDTTVVIVTALAQDQYEEMARQYGVYRYLRKPLDVDDIESITRAALH